MKKKAVTSIVVSISAILLVAIFFVLQNYRTGSNDNTLQNLTPVVNSSVYSLSDWSTYILITDPTDKSLGSGDCGSGEFADFKKTAEAGEIYKLVLPGDYELLWTPNYKGWSNEKFTSFNSDSNSICAVGGRYPLKAYPDRLVWYPGSCGGMMPDKGIAEYDRFQKCQQSKEMVAKYFGISE